MSDATATAPPASESNGAPIPPLAAYRTFDNFVTSLREKDAMPPKIDRSIMVGKSGSDMAFLLGALKFFRLINPTDGAIEPLFQELVSAPVDDRAALLAYMVELQYPNQVKLSNENGTKDQLLDSLGRDFGISGDSRRKAMTFLLHMMKAANMHISEYFPEVRSGSGGTGVRKTAKRTVRKTAEGNGAANGGGDASTRTETTGDSYKVTLIGGGHVTVIIAESHFNLSMNRSDREFVNGLVDAMTDYATAHSQLVDATAQEAP